MTRLFLKSYKIDICEYQKDIESVESDVAEWLSVFPDRYIYDIDIYPYLYILMKTLTKHPSDVDHFLKYFLIVLEKYGVHEDPIISHISVPNVLKFCKENDLFIYLAASIQYFFL
jgi:hypothetical protein